MTEKILVIHPGALGDVVLSFPALVALKRQKKASVSLLCSSDPGKIAHELNVVDAHFSFESARFSSLFHQEMTPGVIEFISDYDTITLISVSDTMEGHLRQNHGGKVHRISPRPPVEEETHVALYIIRQLENKGLLDKCGTRTAASLLKPTGAMRNRQTRDPQSTIRDEASPFCGQAVDQIEGLQTEVVMHPGAGSPRKRWPVERFIQAAASVKGMDLGEVIFVLGPAESDLAPFLKARSRGCFRVCEVSDVSYLMVLLGQARSFVGNDSGVTHLSAFAGIPTVAIFGPSSPKRWSPVGRATRVLRGAGHCAPCFEMDTANCEDPQCLSGVSVDMVLDAVTDLGRLRRNGGHDDAFS